MIIVLEGANGVGKSAYAAMLSKRFSLPAFKAFRDVKAKCKTNGTRKYPPLDQFGVPVNTYIEDFYTVDLLRALNVSALLDRGLPSAIAYNSIPADKMGRSKEMLEYWQKLLREGPAPLLYVWLTAPFDVAKERIEERWCPDVGQFSLLHARYREVFDFISIPKVRIDTVEVEPEEGVEEVCRALKK